MKPGMPVGQAVARPRVKRIVQDNQIVLLATLVVHIHTRV